MDREQRITALMELLEQRIVLLDGAMGTMIQRYGLTEEDYRGERFSDWQRDLKGNNDLLTLTRPAVICEIHQSFLESGADIIETNTFNANAPSMSDYGMDQLVPELNRAAAQLARECADALALVHELVIAPVLVSALALTIMPTCALAIAHALDPARAPVLAPAFALVFVPALALDLC